MSAAQPETFLFSTKSLPSPGKEFRIEEGLLTICGEQTWETSQPMEEDWSRFRRSLNRIGIWHWLPRYERPGIFGDGHVWSVKVAYEDRCVEASGASAYPGPADDEHAVVCFHSTPAFRSLCRAVSRLTDGCDVDGERVVVRDPERLVVERVSPMALEKGCTEELLFEADGGAVWLVTTPDGHLGLRTGETALDGFVAPSDSTSVRWFATARDRSQYLTMRGWLPRESADPTQ